MHQAYFLPWLGYFSKLVHTDYFVVLDDVYFRKRHYYDRTRIVDMHGELHWIGLPVGENFATPCKNIILEDDSFVADLIQTIHHSYAKAWQFEECFPEVAQLLTEEVAKGRTLVDININIIVGICDILDITPPNIEYSSSFPTPDDPTARLVEIGNRLGASEFLIGAGSSLNVHDWSAVQAQGFSILVQDYLKNHPEYSQSRRRRLSFTPGLSVIDSLFNAGKAATKCFITTKNAKPIPLKDAKAT